MTCARPWCGIGGKRCIDCAQSSCPVVPLMRVPCWQCGGDGHVETGFAYESNVGTSRPCGQCAGSGFITVEAPAEKERATK